MVEALFKLKVLLFFLIVLKYCGNIIAVQVSVLQENATLKTTDDKHCKLLLKFLKIH